MQIVGLMEGSLWSGTNPRHYFYYWHSSSRSLLLAGYVMSLVVKSEGLFLSPALPAQLLPLYTLGGDHLLHCLFY